MAQYHIYKIFAKVELQKKRQHAAVNGAKSILANYGVYPTQLHRHAPYSFKRAVFEQMCQEYQQELLDTRRARFRSETDLSFASFLYHHYALNKQLCIERNDEAMIVRNTNFGRFEKKKMFLKMNSFCVNDGDGSALDEKFVQFKKNFLMRLFLFLKAEVKS